MSSLGSPTEGRAKIRARSFHQEELGVSSATALLAEAEASIKAGTWDQALEQLEGLKKDQPNEPEVYEKLAFVLSIRGRFQSVLTTYLELTKIQIDSGALEAADVIVSRILGLQPELTEAREYRIQIETQRGNIPRVIYLSRELARICIDQGDGERSIRLLQDALKYEPDNLDIALELAEMFVSHGHIQDGANQFRKVANAFEESGNIAKAAEAYRRMKVVQSDDPQVLVTLGRLYTELGRLDEAEQEFRSVLRHDLAHEQALFQLGLVSQLKGGFRSGILAFNKVLQNNPNFTEAKRKLAELHYSQGMMTEATSFFLQAAQSYLETEARDEAIDCFQIVLSIDAANQPAQQGLTNLGAPLTPKNFEPPVPPSFVPDPPAAESAPPPPPSFPDSSATSQPDPVGGGSTREPSVSRAASSHLQNAPTPKADPIKALSQDHSGQPHNRPRTLRAGLSGGLMAKGLIAPGGDKPMMGGHSQDKPTLGRPGLGPRSGLGKKLGSPRLGGDKPVMGSGAGADRRPSLSRHGASPSENPSSSQEDVDYRSTKTPSFDRSSVSDPPATEQAGSLAFDDDFAAVESELFNETSTQHNPVEFDDSGDLFGDSDVPAPSFAAATSLSIGNALHEEEDPPFDTPHLRAGNAEKPLSFGDEPTETIFDLDLDDHEAVSGHNPPVLRHPGSSPSAMSDENFFDLEDDLFADTETERSSLLPRAEATASVFGPLDSDGGKQALGTESDPLFDDLFDDHASEPDSGPETIGGAGFRDQKPWAKASTAGSSFEEEPAKANAFDSLFDEPQSSQNAIDTVPSKSGGLFEENATGDLFDEEELFIDPSHNPVEEQLFFTSVGQDDSSEIHESGSGSPPSLNVDTHNTGDQEDSVEDLWSDPASTESMTLDLEPQGGLFGDDNLFAESDLFGDEPTDLPSSFDSSTSTDLFATHSDSDTESSTTSLDTTPSFLESIGPVVGNETLGGGLFDTGGADDLFGGAEDLFSDRQDGDPSSPDGTPPQGTPGLFSGLDDDQNQSPIRLQDTPTDTDPPEQGSDLFNETDHDVSPFFGSSPEDDREDILTFHQPPMDDLFGSESDALDSSSLFEEENILGGEDPPPLDLDLPMPDDPPLFPSKDDDVLSSIEPQDPQFKETTPGDESPLSDDGFNAPLDFGIPELSSEPIYPSSLDPVSDLKNNETTTIASFEGSFSQTRYEPEPDIVDPELFDMLTATLPKPPESLNEEQVIEPEEPAELDSSYSSIESHSEDSPTQPLFESSYEDPSGTESDSLFEVTAPSTEPSITAPPEPIDLLSAEERQYQNHVAQADELELSLGSADAATKIGAYRKALEENPDNLVLRTRLADIHLKYGLLEDAVVQYRQVLRRNPDSIPLLHSVIQAEFWNEDYDEAGASLLALALLHLKRGEHHEALDTLQSVLSLDPLNFEARRELVNVFTSLEESKLAAHHLRQLAEAAMTKGEVTEAISAFERLLEISDDPTFEERLGQIYESQGDIPKALTSFHNLVRRYREEQRWEEAARVTERIVELAPETLSDREELIDLYQQLGMGVQAATQQEALGRIYQDRGELERSIKLYEEVLRFDTTNFQVRRYLVDAYLDSGHVSSALEQTESLTEHYLDTKDHATAIALYSRLVGADPENIELQERLVKFYGLAGDPENAKVRWLEIAKIHERLARFDKAADSLQKALDLGDGEPELLFRLALLYSEKIHDNTAALHQLRKLFQIAPNRIDTAKVYIGLLIKEEQVPEAGQVLKKLEEAGASGAEIRDAVVSSLRAKVEANPGDLQARFNYGQLCYHLGDLDHAIEQFQQTRRQPAFELLSYNMLGLCFASKNGYMMLDLAIRQFKKGLETKGHPEQDYLEIRYSLATTYYRNGRLAEALTELRECYRVDIAYRDVRSLIQKIETEQAAGA